MPKPKKIGQFSCPSCGHQISHVVDTRWDGYQQRRRRLCDQCKERFTTFEITADDLLVDQDRLKKAVTKLKSGITQGVNEIISALDRADKVASKRN